MKISQRDIKLLMILGCVLVLGASYFLGFKKYNDLTEEMDTKTTALRTEYNTLSASNQHRAEYTSIIEENKEKIAAIVAKYPANITNQDEIYLSKLMEQQSGVWINIFNTTASSIVFTPQDEDAQATDAKTTTDTEATTDTKVTTNTETSDANKTSDQNDFSFIGYQMTTQLSFQADYQQMKKLVEYINNYAFRKSIKSISLAVDTTTGLLTGTLDYNSYSLTGAGTTYTPLTIPSQPTGVDNIFNVTVENNNAD